MWPPTCYPVILPQNVSLYSLFPLIKHSTLFFLTLISVVGTTEFIASYLLSRDRSTRLSTNLTCFIPSEPVVYIHLRNPGHELKLPVVLLTLLTRMISTDQYEDFPQFTSSPQAKKYVSSSKGEWVSTSTQWRCG